MTDRPLTLMAVHAHPDDEASSTGGVLARYAAEGLRTVIVLCTDGGCGDGPDGVKPGEPGHDPRAVAALRAAELEESCTILGVSHLERLEYGDSGMMGWASNSAPGAFWATPVEVAAARLADLMRHHRPDVVVTYDENGFYGHPDHVQANRVTVAAIDRLGPDEAPAKLYWSTIAHSVMREFAVKLREQGADWAEDPDAVQLGAPDEQITTWVDTVAFAEQKYRALGAHVSQPDNAYFLKLGLETFTDLLGVETFVRVRDTTGRSQPAETDLFDGLR
jgi:LmbE family N-acetylglucosaminyl deacetylase